MENYLTKEKNEKLTEKDRKEYEDFIRNLDSSILNINGRSNNDRIAVYYKLKEYGEVIKYIQELFRLQIRYDINNVIGYETLIYIGKVYYFRNDFNDAVYYFNQSKNKYKNDPEVYYCLGASFYKLKDYNRALYNFKKSIKIDSDFFESYNMISLCYKELNNTAGCEYYREEYISHKFG